MRGLFGRQWLIETREMMATIKAANEMQGRVQTQYDAYINRIAEHSIFER